MPQQFIGASASQNVITFPKYFQSQGEKTQIALYMSTHTRAHTLATAHPLTCGSLLFILIKLSVICRYGFHFSTSSVRPTEKVNLPNSTQTLSASANLEVSLTLPFSPKHTHTHSESPIRGYWTAQGSPCQWFHIMKNMRFSQRWISLCVCEPTGGRCLVVDRKKVWELFGDHRDEYLNKLTAWERHWWEVSHDTLGCTELLQVCKRCWPYKGLRNNYLNIIRWW